MAPAPTAALIENLFPDYIIADKVSGLSRIIHRKLLREDENKQIK